MHSRKKVERRIELGERYMVAWRNGQKHPGDIIEIRPLKSGKDSSSDEKSVDDDISNFEYYIHFPNFDRRLDEWVTIDRIDLHTVVVGSADKDNGTDHNSVRKTQKRKLIEMSADKRDDKEAILVALEKEHEEVTKVKNIQSIVLGKYQIEAWYFSPYPDEYAGDEKMFICEFCLKYMKKQVTFANHCLKCTMRHPPGREIYREETLSMFEVDGKDNKLYCQNLCLLSKLFLDHKTLYYDVDPFLFYILCEVDEKGYHIVGYFSKEKQSQENYNLACILTFPPYQRKGYGKFLMSVSYELTKREGTTGSPEKPLSDLGKISYRSYWAYIILTVLQNRETLKSITIQEIGRLTGIKLEDILSTMHSLSMIKYWKGQHVISVSSKAIDIYLAQAKKIRLCNPSCLNWQPPEKISKKA